MTTHEVLVEARNLIDREGWMAGSGYSGPYCAAGALCAASGGLEGREPGWGDALDLVSELATGNPRCPHLFRWNDTEGRTKEQVLAKFDEAIALTAPLPEDLDLSGLAGTFEALV